MTCRRVLSYSLTLVSVRAGMCVRGGERGDGGVHVSGRLTFKNLAFATHHLWSHFCFALLFPPTRMHAWGSHLPNLRNLPGQL